MKQNIFTLGDGEVLVTENWGLVFYDSQKEKIELFGIEPHELRRLAKAIEDANRLRDLGEDSNHIA